MTQFSHEDDKGVKKIVSNSDVIFESDRDQDGSGDLVFRSGGVERARISAAGVGTGWGDVLGGSLPFSVKLYGAKGDGTTDDTAAIQAAITAATAAGGYVYFPAGQYKITSQLVVENCVLLGVGAYNFSHASGSVLNITDTSLPAILLKKGGEVRGMNFFYPNQVTTSTATVYPATIKCYEAVGDSIDTCSTIRDCTFINSYIAIDTGGSSTNGNPLVRIFDNRICAISIGVKHPYSTVETPIMRNQFSYTFWPGSLGGAIRTTIARNAVAIQLGNGTDSVTGTWVTGNTVFGFLKGVYFAGDGGITTIADNMFDGCLYGIDFSGVSSQCGEVSISGGVIGATDASSGGNKGYAIGANWSSGSARAFSFITINGVSFEASDGDQINFTSSVTSRVGLSITGCSFNASRRLDTSTASYGIYLSGDGIRAAISGNTFIDEVNGVSGKMVGIYMKVYVGSVTGNTFYWLDKSVDCSAMTSGTHATVVGNSAFTTTTRDLYYPSSQGIANIANNRWSKGIGSLDESAVGSYTATAAATLTLPESYDFITVSGATGITSITASWPGRHVTLQFGAGGTTVTDGSNLTLASSFTTTPQDTLSLVCDGVNWIETGRSVN